MADPSHSPLCTLSFHLYTVNRLFLHHRPETQPHLLSLSFLTPTHTNSGKSRSDILNYRTGHRRPSADVYLAEMQFPVFPSHST